MIDLFITFLNNIKVFLMSVLIDRDCTQEVDVVTLYSFDNKILSKVFTLNALPEEIQKMSSVIIDTEFYIIRRVLNYNTGMCLYEYYPIKARQNLLGKIASISDRLLDDYSISSSVDIAIRSVFKVINLTLSDLTTYELSLVLKRMHLYNTGIDFYYEDLNRQIIELWK